MGAPQLREELLCMIESGDQKLLKILYAVAREYTEETYFLPGSPMEIDTLKNRVREASARVKSGKYSSQEDLEKEMKEW